jgi:hypothetical protein
MVPQMLQQLQEAFQRTLAGQSLGEDAIVRSKMMQKLLQQKSEFGNLRGGLMLVMPFLEMLGSSAFKGKTVRA